MHILQIREYKANHTDGELYINGDTNRYCYTLEDAARPCNIKIDGETCIPEGHYKCEVSRSQRFQKDMILLYNTPDKAVERNGVRFTGIRVHGVNDVDDTEGCIGAMYRSDGQGRAWERASDDLCTVIADAIDNGEIVTWTITSN